MASSRMNQGVFQAQRDAVVHLQLREITSDRQSAPLGVCFTAQCVHSNAVVCCTIGKTTSTEGLQAYERIVRAYQEGGGEPGTVQVRVVKQLGDGTLAVDFVDLVSANSIPLTPPVAKRRRYYR